MENNSPSFGQIQKILKVEQKSNNEINRLLAKEKEKLRNEVTLLILGPGESGKSTVAKQLRIINSNPWTDEERLAYKDLVIRNVLKSIRDVIRASLKCGYTISNENQSVADKLSSCESLTPDIAEHITNLLKDEAIQKTLLRSSEFLLKDSAPYYFGEVHRLAEPQYIPSDQDILRSRKKTTAIVETFFEVENTKVRLIDVGGQRSQRKKWIHLFQDVTAVLFCASLSCYDLNLREDAKVNSMDDSLQLFEEIVNSAWFVKTPIILFLNKVDLFKQKVETSPITVCFNDYKGDPNNADEAISFMKRKFFALNKTSDKIIYSHITCATDTNNIATVFNTIRKILLHQTINNRSNV